MIKAIFRKEWKRHKWVCAAFLVAAIAIPGILAQFSYDQGAHARNILQFIWVVFSVYFGLSFRGEKRRGSIMFLLARPATQPYLLGAHYLSYLTMLAGLFLVSLFANCFHMEFKAADISMLDILFEPDLVFAVALCLMIFAFFSFVSSTAFIFGTVAVGVAIFLLILICVVFPEQILNIASYRRQLTVASFPITRLLIYVSGACLFGTLTLWQVSFNELRDVKNKQWIFAITGVSILSLAFFTASIKSIANTFGRPCSPMKIEEIITTGSSEYPLFCVMSNKNEDRFLFAVRNSVSIRKTNKFMGEGKDRIDVVRKVNKQDKFFYPLTDRRYGDRGSVLAGTYWRYSRAYAKREKSLIFFSDLPLWREEIRLLDLGGYYIKVISHRQYSRKEKLGKPFLSPDRDRIAYLKTSAFWLGGASKTALCITKFHFDPISDCADLASDADVTWEPIGWTPDGYDFILQKNTAKGPEIWAVDWVAQGPRRFLEAFPNVVITKNDLPKGGDWISLVRQEPGGKFALWLVNYRFGEKIDIGVFDQSPARTWSQSGEVFACQLPDGTLHIYHVAAEKPFEKHICSDVPLIRQTKWAPYGSYLAALVDDFESPGKKSRLLVFQFPLSNIAALLRSEKKAATLEEAKRFEKIRFQLEEGFFHKIELVQDFPSNERQWDWLTNQAIVYTDGTDLWQVDLDGEKSLLLSTKSFPAKD